MIFDFLFSCSDDGADPEKLRFVEEFRFLLRLYKNHEFISAVLNFHFKKMNGLCATAPDNRSLF